VVVCLERDADLRMAQPMPLPLTVFCFSKIQIGFTFLVLAHPGSPIKRAVKRACVCVCLWCSQLVGMITRDFLREGWLHKTGPRAGDAFRRRWFTLDNRRLMYFEDPMVCSSILQPSSIRGLGTPWTYILHLSLSSVILTDSSTESPVHVLMLSIKAVRGLPRLRAPGIVPCIIPCFLIV